MPHLEIVKFPNPVLKKMARAIELITKQEKTLLDDMLETMYLNQGAGLAAPQVGVLKRAIVVDVGEGPLQLINPIIAKRFGLEAGQEGCLSLPGVMITVKRAKKILYRGSIREGRLIEGAAEGLLARAIQHEIDHLEGRLIIDYVNPIKRFFLKKKLLEKTQP